MGDRGNDPVRPPGPPAVGPHLCHHGKAAGMTLTTPLTAPPPFEPGELLPEGVTSLEASAGTGKTHAVASLVAAEIASGRHTIDDILVVTFTRKATSTLRER